MIGALAVHYIFGGVRLQGVGDRMTTAARAHLTTLVAVFVLLKAVAYILDRRALLLEQHERADLYGAGYTDVNALLPAKEILAYISIVVAIAIIVFSNAVMRNLVWPGVSLALLAISAVAIGGIYPLAVQTFKVKPSLRDKEAPYIERVDRRRPGTRSGWPTTEITAVRGAQPEAAGDAGHRHRVVPNVRLIDPQLVSEAYTQLQQVRGFYDFGQKLDIDRYTVDGKTQDYVVGVREINYGELTAQQQQLAEPAHRLHPRLRHGRRRRPTRSSAAACRTSSPASSATTSSAGCASATEQIPVDQPRIYYGEQSTRVRDRRPDRRRTSNVEFDRPQPSDNDAEEHYTYDGKGGVRDRLVLPPAALRDQEHREQLPALRRGQRQLPADVRARPARPGGEGRAVPHHRRRPVPGRGRRADPVDPRRLHDRGDLPVRAADQPAERDHRRADQPGHVRSSPGTTSTTCATR